METTTREEHLKWCKDRALEYIEMGEPEHAFNSFMSDLFKHEETKTHPKIQKGIISYLSGRFENAEEAKRFIINEII
jgi:hypothetical protein